MRARTSARANFGRRLTVNIDGEEYQIRYHPIAAEAKLEQLIKEKVKSPLAVHIQQTKDGAAGSTTVYEKLIMIGWDEKKKASEVWPPAFFSQEFVDIICKQEFVRVVLEMAFKDSDAELPRETLHKWLNDDSKVGELTRVFAFYLWGREPDDAAVEEAQAIHDKIEEEERGKD